MLACAALLEMSFIYPDYAVNTDYFTDNNASGGDTGSSFQLIRLEGSVLKNIKAWRQDWRIRGIVVTMSDGSSYLAGKREGEEYSEFTFQSGERITRLNLQASAARSAVGKRRLGAIWFKTSKNNDWGIFSRGLETNAQYWPEVGSGICCGIFGASCEDVDRLGFAMLRNIKESMVTNVKYPYLSMQNVATTPDTVAEQDFINSSSVAQTYELKGSKTVAITRSWSLSNTLSMTVETKVTAGIPEVASVESGFSWTVSSTSVYETSKTVTDERSWSWPLICPPRTRILGTATMYADNIDTDYVADMELRLENGKVFRYTEKGVYNGLNSRTGNVKIEELGPA